MATRAFPSVPLQIHQQSGRADMADHWPGKDSYIQVTLHNQADPKRRGQPIRSRIRLLSCHTLKTR